MSFGFEQGGGQGLGAGSRIARFGQGPGKKDMYLFRLQDVDDGNQRADLDLCLGFLQRLAGRGTPLRSRPVP